jgi:hypothetical protein
MSTQFYNEINLQGNPISLDSIARVDSDGNLIDIDSLRDTPIYKNIGSLSQKARRSLLLFNKDNWEGEFVLVRNGEVIRNLIDYKLFSGKKLEGDIRSIRINPFKIFINFIVVTGENGELPGHWADRGMVSDGINSIITQANAFFERQDALIKLVFRDLNFRRSEQKFNMSEKERDSIPLAWKKKNTVDVVLVNRIELAAGRADFPGKGKFCAVALDRHNTTNDDGDITESATQKIARTFVHELGHYWGLTHGSKENDIMTQSDDGGPLAAAEFTDGQLNIIHQTLSGDSSRSNERVE